MIPDYDDLFRLWFLIDPDGERPSYGPFDSKKEAEAFWQEWCEEHDSQAA